MPRPRIRSRHLATLSAFGRAPDPRGDRARREPLRPAGDRRKSQRRPPRSGAKRGGGRDDGPSAPEPRRQPRPRAGPDQQRQPRLAESDGRRHFRPLPQPAGRGDGPSRGLQARQRDPGASSIGPTHRPVPLQHRRRPAGIPQRLRRPGRAGGGRLEPGRAAHGHRRRTIRRAPSRPADPERPACRLGRVRARARAGRLFHIR